MKGRHSYNLWRHIQRKHKEIAKSLEPEVKRFQSYLNHNDNGESISVKFYKNELIKSCVELVTVNGRALSLVNDSGFRRLTIELSVNDAIDRSPEDKQVINSARESVKKLRAPTILNLQLIQKKELRNPLIDCVTRWGSTHTMVSNVIDTKLLFTFS